MLTKIISPSGWGWQEPVAQMVKVSSRGLREGDYLQFVKRAGEELAFRMRDYIVPAGHEPVHILALGATEHWGFNRNGDGFKEATCREYHNTFVKYARIYRNHLNTDPAKSYGVVKESFYNERMHRVELLGLLNATEEAARQNGGLVADDELTKLAAGEDPPTSMSCLVPFDECVVCGNRARTKAAYCTADTCEGGGCKDNLGRLVKIGRDVVQMGVDNPRPRFFDISKVYKGADRTSYMSRAEWLAKAAGQSGVSLAEEMQISAPRELFLDARCESCSEESLGQRLKIARAMVALRGSPLGDSARALDYRLRGELPCGELRKSAEDLRLGLAALADAGIVLTAQQFSEATGRQKVASEVGLLSCLDRDDDGEALKQSAYSQIITAEPTPAWHSRAYRLKAAHSLYPDEARRRVWLSVARGYDVPERSLIKQAGDPDASHDYAAYQLAALYRMAERQPAGFTLTTTLAAAQNDVVKSRV